MRSCAETHRRPISPWCQDGLRARAATTKRKRRKFPTRPVAKGHTRIAHGKQQCKPEARARVPGPAARARAPGPGPGPRAPGGSSCVSNSKVDHKLEPNGYGQRRVCVSVCVFLSVSVRVRVCVCLFVCVSVSVRIYVCVYMFVCIDITSCSKKRTKQKGRHDRRPKA